MKNTYNFAGELMNGGLVGIITNKKVKASKRYLIYIGCILFYLILIALCFFNGIGNFNKNMILFFILNILGVILVIDLFRLMHNVQIMSKNS